MRKALVIILAAGMLAATAADGPVLADDATFTITDYIPERFRDFQWRLDGSFDLSGEDDSRLQYDILNPLYFSEADQSSSSLATYLATRASYDYATVQNFLTLSGELRAGFDRTSSEIKQLYSTSAEDIHESTAGTDGSSHSYDLSPSLTTQAGQYLSGDFFLSARLKSTMSYDRTPKDDSNNEETDLDVVGGVVWSDRTSDSHDSGHERKHNVILGEFLPGWGRVYDGRYASTAMYMIEELRANEALLREPTRDEMLRLTDLIYLNRLEHAVDERIRRIEIFDEIIDYLVRSGVIAPAGHYGHLLIEDVWDYFPRTQRRFGFKATGGVGMLYAYNRTTTTTDSESERLVITYPQSSPASVDTLVYEDYSTYRYSYRRSRASEMYLTGELAYFRPLARKWQLDLFAEIECVLGASYKLDNVSAYASEEFGGSADYRRTSLRDRSIDKEWSVNPSAELTYIYDSRTSLSWQASYLYFRQNWSEELTADYPFVDPDEDRTGDEKTWAVHLGGTLEYRLSIPTTISVGADYRYWDRETTDGDRGQLNDHGRYSLSVAVQHYIY